MASWIGEIADSAQHCADSHSGDTIQPPQRDGDTEEFSDGGETHTFKIRGRTYPFDNVKISSPGAMSALLCVHTFEASEDRIDHIASQGRMKAIMDNLLSDDDTDDMKAFKRLWHQFIDIPPNEESRRAQWTIETEAAHDHTGACGDEKDRTWAEWVVSRDVTWPDPEEAGVLPQSDFRNCRFKLISYIKSGPVPVKAAVPTKPTILGHKLVQRYFRGDRYMEIDIDITSSVVASNIVSLCRGCARYIECECAVMLQGECEEELPEKILACILMKNLDFETCHIEKLYTGE